MATGLQYKENLTLISGGYSGEGIGSNGVTQDWTDVSSLSGSSTVTYYYHDSASLSDANSTIVRISVTDSWSASVNSGTNQITVTVSSTLNSVVREVVGSPTAYSTSMFVKRTADGGVLWSANCVNASISESYIGSPISLGSTTFTLNPGDSSNVHGTIYYRSNTCGHDGDTPPSLYVDEFWLGINFRNTLPTPTTYVLDYNMNGGSGGPADASYTTGLPSYTFTVSDVEPTWGHYTFLGWSDTPIDKGEESDVVYRAGDQITVSQASPTKTIYAVWRKDYRPGKNYDGNGTWLSHNRASGWAGIYDGSAFKEMRTEGNGIVTDNPPFIRYEDDWRTEREIGQE